jgi:hypothetical protein
MPGATLRGEMVEANESTFFVFDPVPQIPNRSSTGSHMWIWFKNDLFGPGDSLNVTLHATTPEWEHRSLPFAYRPEDFVNTGRTQSDVLTIGTSSAPWPNARGFIELSVISGSVNVDRLEINIDVDYSASYFGIFQPIPEPKTTVFLLMAGALLTWRLKCPRTGC